MRISEDLGDFDDFMISEDPEDFEDLQNFEDFMGSLGILRTADVFDNVEGF